MSAPIEESIAHERCERCDREARHMLKLTAPDNSVHHVCWSCLQRDEKRVNLRTTWKRSRRGDNSSNSRR